jgi:Cu/Ag efflux protein CusF
MTMEFDVDRDVRLDGIEAGQDIRFALRQEHAGHWVVSEVGGRPDLDAGTRPDTRPADPTPVQPTRRYAGQGTVRALDRGRRMLNIAHEPIAELGWPGMTMDFPVAEAIDLDGIKAGQDIEFTIRKEDDGAFVIDEIHAQEGTAGAQVHDHD